MVILANVVSAVFTALYVLVLAHVLLSWVLPPQHQVRLTIDNLVSPMMNPVRKIMPPMGGLDFSPIIVLFGLDIVKNLLLSFLR